MQDKLTKYSQKKLPSIIYCIKVKQLHILLGIAYAFLHMELFFSTQTTLKKDSNKNPSREYLPYIKKQLNKQIIKSQKICHLHKTSKPLSDLYQHIILKIYANIMNKLVIKNQIYMIVSMKSQPNNRAQIEKILQLTISNYSKLKQYFNFEDENDWKILQFSHGYDQSQNNIGTNNQILESIMDYLLKSNQMLSNSPTTFIPSIKNCNQYSYLQNSWIRHFQRNKTFLSMEDKIDNLNKTISYMKLHTRQLIAQQNKRNNQIWRKQVEYSRSENVWEHPFFEQMNQTINNLKMEKYEMEYKIWVQSKEKSELAKKNKELEERLLQYKQKNKKSQKQIFEMAKKKAQLQKQMIIKNEISNKAAIVKQQNNKQNKNTNQAEFISFLKQENERSYMTQSVKPSQFSQLSIRQKFKYATKKSTACISPNTSVDSIRSVKFERTNSKKFFIKNQ